MGESIGRFVPPHVRADAEVLLRGSFDAPQPGKFVFPKEREDRVADKLRRFRVAGPDKILAVLDFDRTMTMGTLPNGRDVTVLAHHTSHLPPDVRDARYAVSSRYRELEEMGTLGPADSHDWYVGAVKLFGEHGLHQPTLSSDFVTAAQPRPGIVATFETLNYLHIPTIVLSAGLHNPIDAWCKHYGIRPDSIISTKLKVDDVTGNIFDYDVDSFVHSFNKAIRLQDEIQRYSDRPLKIVIGDAMSDADVVEGEEDVLRIRIKELKEGETPAEKEAFRQQTFTKFDLLIEDGGFAALVEFLGSLGVPEMPASAEE